MKTPRQKPRWDLGGTIGARLISSIKPTNESEASASVGLSTQYCVPNAVACVAKGQACQSLSSLCQDMHVPVGGCAS